MSARRCLVVNSALDLKNLPFFWMMEINNGDLGGLERFWRFHFVFMIFWVFMLYDLRLICWLFQHKYLLPKSGPQRTRHLISSLFLDWHRVGRPSRVCSTGITPNESSFLNRRYDLLVSLLVPSKKPRLVLKLSVWATCKLIQHLLCSCPHQPLPLLLFQQTLFKDLKNGVNALAESGSGFLSLLLLSSAV